MIILNVLIVQNEKGAAQVSIMGSELRPTDVEGRVTANLVNAIQTRLAGEPPVKVPDANGSAPVPQPQETLPASPTNPN